MKTKIVKGMDIYRNLPKEYKDKIIYQAIMKIIEKECQRAEYDNKE